MVGPIEFLDAVAGYARADSKASSDRPIKMARIDPAYNAFATHPAAPPPARVIFPGETLSGKYYAVANGYIPVANERCWMVPIGTTYLIAGAVGQQTMQGFWQYADGTESGTEFGDGSFFDTMEGLYINNDATITGSARVGGKPLLLSPVRELRGASGTVNTTSGTFIFLAGPNSYVGFVKQGTAAETNLEIICSFGARRTTAVGGSTNTATAVRFGVTVDYAVTYPWVEVAGGEMATLNAHEVFSGSCLITGVTAGTHDISLGVRRWSGGGTITIDSFDFQTMLIREVYA